MFFSLCPLFRGGVGWVGGVFFGIHACILWFALIDDFGPFPPPAPLWPHLFRRSALSEPDDDDVMSALDERSLDRMNAMHLEASREVPSGETNPDMEFSDVDSQEGELDGPAMRAEVLADAMEDSDADLFDF